MGKVIATSERDLVAAAQAGDREAFGQLVSRYGMLVHGLCRGMAGSVWDAQDLAHDAFVEAWLNLASLRDPARFAPWLRTLTLNLCRMWHRQRRREREGLACVEAGEGRTDGPGPEGVEGDAVGQLADGLGRLSADHRLALALHYRAELSYEQMAAFLEVPIGTVMSRLHRARANLKKRMVDMPDTDDEQGSDPLRQAVDAEIGVLLQVWEEESRDRTVDSRYRTATCQRLSVLLESSPDLVRPVLCAAGEALVGHLGIRVRQAGPPAIEVTVACAFDEDEALRARARKVLCHILTWAADQANNEPYFTLPPRQAASFVLDSVLRSARAEPEKAALLADLLPGCQDDATLILMGCALLCFPEEAFALLWQGWWSQEEAADGPPSPPLAVLSRFGSPFLRGLVGELEAADGARVRQALAGVHAVANRIDLRVLTRLRSPDPALEWRTGGGLRGDEIDPPVRRDLCRRLAALVQDERPEIRDRAVAALGSMGGPEQAAALRPCLDHPEPSTRVAAIYALRDLEDAGCAPALMCLVGQDGVGPRRAALQALGQLRVAAAADLAAGLVQDPEVQAQAISALGEIGGDAARAALKKLIGSADKKVARLAAGALYGGQRTARPTSDTTRERLRRVRGEAAQPLLHISEVAALRNLPEVRPYGEPELTRFIGEVCGDYSTTRRQLVMDRLMTRQGGVYELTESGRALWRVERFIKDHYLGGAAA